MWTLQALIGLLVLIASIEAQAPFKISLSAKDLPNMDIMNGRPDPFVKILKAEGSTSNVYVPLGQTSSLSDTNNPTWKEVFNLKLVLGAYQRLRLEVLDKDINANDPMGKVDVTFAQIANAKNSTTEHPIVGCSKPNCGRLLIKRVL